MRDVCIQYSVEVEVSLEETHDAREVEVLARILQSDGEATGVGEWTWWRDDDIQYERMDCKLSTDALVR